MSGNKFVPGTHIGFKLYVTNKNEPKYIEEPLEKPPTLQIYGWNRPVLLPSRLTTKMIMEQENENGSGKYFNNRKPAYETTDSEWSVLYETRRLILMSDPEKYISIWPTKGHPKSKFHILETSVRLFDTGPMILESIQITTDHRVRFASFAIKKLPENKFFDTDQVHGLKLARQSSNEKFTSRDFLVDCRPLVKRDEDGFFKKVLNIDMVFIVYLNTISLELKDVINKEDYHRINQLENVLMFKQIES